VTPPKDSPFRLMVEGKDDEHAIIHLLLRHGYSWEWPQEWPCPYVHSTNSVDELLKREMVTSAIKTYWRSGRRLGLVLDADDKGPARWASLRDSFALEGLDLPPQPERDGTVLEGPDGRRIGLWLMPDNTVAGALEDFLLTLIPEGDLRQHAEASTVKARTLGSLPAKDHSKGVVHAWLAWQREPGLPLGIAIKGKFLGHESPLASRFVGWFQRLFVDGLPDAQGQTARKG
jgi:hypothetical protein